MFHKVKAVQALPDYRLRVAFVPTTENLMEHKRDTIKR